MIIMNKRQLMILLVAVLVIMTGCSSSGSDEEVSTDQDSTLEVTVDTSNLSDFESDVSNYNVKLSQNGTVVKSKTVTAKKVVFGELDSDTYKIKVLANDSNNNIIASNGREKSIAEGVVAKSNIKVKLHKAELVLDINVADYDDYKLKYNSKVVASNQNNIFELSPEISNLSVELYKNGELANTYDRNIDLYPGQSTTVTINSDENNNDDSEDENNNKVKTPTDLSVKLNESGYAELSWSNNGVDGYRVYRSTSINGDKRMLTTDTFKMSNFFTSKFIDVDLDSSDSQYYYWVKAISSEGEKSEFSEPAILDVAGHNIIKPNQTIEEYEIDKGEPLSINVSDHKEINVIITPKNTDFPVGNDVDPGKIKMRATGATYGNFYEDPLYFDKHPDEKPGDFDQTKVNIDDSDQNEVSDPEPYNETDPVEEEEEFNPKIGRDLEVGEVIELYALNGLTGDYKVEHETEHLYIVQQNEDTPDYSQGYYYNHGGLDDYQIERLADEFENNIFSTVMDTFAHGDYDRYDWDKNGKLIVVLRDLGGDRKEDKGVTVGVFSTKDYPTDDPDYPVVKGKDRLHGENEMDLVILNYNVPSRPDPGYNMDKLVSTLAHEFQHLIYHREKMLANRSAKESWINEGLSTYIENKLGYNGIEVRYSINNSLTYWNPSDSYNEEYNNSLTSVTYLVERFGEGILKDIAYGDSPRETIENYAGVSFKEVYTDFITTLTLANDYRDGFDRLGEYDVMGDHNEPILYDEKTIGAGVSGWEAYNISSSQFISENNAVMSFSVINHGREKVIKIGELPFDAEVRVIAR
mgnify:CR=1 FL=1